MIGLIIIDMQDELLDDHLYYCELLKNIQKEIKLAKRRRAPIILVEYKNEGETHKDIHLVLNAYPYERVIKPHNDGSKEIFHCLLRKFYSVPIWRVCGIFLECCISETLISLSNQTKTEFELIEKGVGSFPCTDLNSKSRYFTKLQEIGVRIR